MASVFKRPGARKYTVVFVDECGKRCKKIGYSDKSESKRLGDRLEEQARRIKDGSIDPREEQYRLAGLRPLSEHLAAWAVAIDGKGVTTKHTTQFVGRARRLLALVAGAKMIDISFLPSAAPERMERVEATLVRYLASMRLRDMTEEKVQAALGALRTEGFGLGTINGYRRAIMAFSKWCYSTRRAREYDLHGVTGFNAKEDRRHDRRTIALDELRQLIAVAEQGPEVMGMTGPVRALAYRLAVATGLRYAELRSITPEWFDWKAPSVTVAAGYTKNGDPATLHLLSDLASDLAAYVATVEPGAPVFPLPDGLGALMLRHDLEAAGIEYRDSAGLVFDFHSLRCQTATLADAAGVSPRVVQKLMRHSSLELTGRYTRPRAHDIEAGASLIPSLKPADSAPERLAMTGTDPSATKSATIDHQRSRNSNDSTSCVKIAADHEDA